MNKLLFEEDLIIESKPNNAPYIEAVYSENGAVVFKATDDKSKNVSKEDIKTLLGD